MKLRVAIPNKGRMRGPSIELLKSAGIKISGGDERSLFVKTNNPDIDIISVRVEDIPAFVGDGIADLGITGRDVIEEKKYEGKSVMKGKGVAVTRGSKVKELLPLNFGYCSLVLAIKESSKIRSVSEIADGTRVATKFNKIAGRYFEAKKKKVEIVELSGAVEIAPVIGLADMIVDITSTGSTLKSHGLKILDVILKSQAVLIGNEKVKGEMLDDLLMDLKGVVDADKKKYLMANLPHSALKLLERSGKGALSPTITKLDKKDWISVQMVVEEKMIFALIKKLKELGGRDILVLPIERLVK